MILAALIISALLIGLGVFLAWKEEQPLHAIILFGLGTATFLAVLVMALVKDLMS